MTDSGAQDSATVAKVRRGPDFVVPEHGRIPGSRRPTFSRPTGFAGGVDFSAGALPPLAGGPYRVVAPSAGPGSPAQRRPGPGWPVIALLTVLAGALLIIGIGAGVMILNRPPVARPMPEDTARAFVEAAYRSDYSAVRSTIADEFWDGAGLTCLDVSFHGVDFSGTTVADWAFTDSEIDGDQATLTLDPPGDIPSTALRMRLVDGAWKITNWQF